MIIIAEIYRSFDFEWLVVCCVLISVWLAEYEDEEEESKKN